MLIFSNYSKSFENIHISQPVVDINLEDTNKYIVRYPKFKRITHLILSFDAENLFLNSKSAYGYSLILKKSWAILKTRLRMDILLLE